MSEKMKKQRGFRVSRCRHTAFLIATTLVCHGYMLTKVIADPMAQFVPGELKWKWETESPPPVGAAWRIDDGEWLQPNAETPDLPPGRYAIEFKRLPGWKEPQAMNALVVGGVESEFEADYHELPVYYAPWIPKLLTTPASGIRFVIELSNFADPLSPDVTVQSILATPEPDGTMSYDEATGEFEFVPAASDVFEFNVFLTLCTNGDCTQDSILEHTFTIAPKPTYKSESEIIQFTNQHQGVFDRDVEFAIANNQVVWKANELILEQGNPNLLFERFNGTPLNELQIYAEKVIVRSKIELPSTDLSIFAREIHFEGGQFDLSGESAPQTKPGNPGEGRDGARGDHGGSVELQAEVFTTNEDSPCFVLNGGRGQPAGEGEDGNDGISYFYPVGPGVLPCDPFNTYPQGWRAVFWKFVLYPFDSGGVQACPTSGTDAVCAGRPGRGGNGGWVSSSFDLSDYVESEGGSPGSKGYKTYGGSRGNPQKACWIFIGTPCWDFKCTVVNVHYCPITQNGDDCSAPSGQHGQDGGVEPVSGQSAWMHPVVMSMMLERARSSYFHSKNAEASATLEEILERYNANREELHTRYGTLEYNQLENEIASLALRIASGLDYFGNPVGWVPMLSFEVNYTAFESEAEAAIPILYFVKYLKAAAEQDRTSIEALEGLRGELVDAIDSLTASYNTTYTEIGTIESDYNNLITKIESTRNNLIAREQQLAYAAQHNVEESHKTEWWKKALSVLGSALQVFPVTQPLGGLVNSVTGALDDGFSLGDLGSIIEGIDFGAIPWNPFPPLEEEFNSVVNRPYSSFEELAETISPVIRSTYNAAQDITSVLRDKQAPAGEVEAELQRLKEHDPIFTDLVDSILALNNQKEQFAMKLKAVMDSLNTLKSDIERMAVTIVTLDRARTQDGRFDALGVAYLDAMEQRTRERLLKYHYTMAKSYQYRILKPYPGDLELSNSFLQRIEAMIFADSISHELLPVTTSINFGDPSSQFSDLKQLFVEELREVIARILEELNQYGPTLTGTATVRLTNEELNQLNGSQSNVTIDLSKRDTFGLREEDIRIVSLNTTKLAVDEQTSVLRLYWDHSGISNLRRKGTNYFFQHYRDELTNPLVWTTKLEPGAEQWEDSEISPAEGSLLCTLLDIGCDDNVMLFARPGGRTKLMLSRDPSQDVISQLEFEVGYDYRVAPTSQVQLEVNTVGGGLPMINLTPSDRNQRSYGRLNFSRFYGESTQLVIHAEPRVANSVFQKFVVNPHVNPVEIVENPMPLTLSSNTTVQVVYAGNESGVCGDGIVNPGEECDDGNNSDGDGCQANCTTPTCGNDACDGIEDSCICPEDCGEAKASRVLPDSYCPGEPVDICINLEVPPSTTAVGIDECPPTGWLVEEVSDGGQWDPDSGKIRWGPYFAPLPSTVCYQARSPEEASDPPTFGCGEASFDGFNESTCGGNTIAASCCPSAPADTMGPACDECADCSCGDCEDGEVELCELIGFACSWKKGCHDDLSGVIRSAFLWKDGSPYCWEQNSDNWIPSPDGQDTGCCETVPAIAGGSLGSDGSATGTIHRRGGLTHVRINVDVPPTTLAYGLELFIPRSWEVDSFEGHGEWDEVNRKLKFGPFFDAVDDTFAVNLRPLIRQQNIRSNLGGDLRALKGTVSFDGRNRPIEWKRLRRRK
ncbi:MAG: myxococcus cysteine-rich repeat containing protein [Phycisphaerae bacterium]